MGRAGVPKELGQVCYVRAHIELYFLKMLQEWNVGQTEWRIPPKQSKNVQSDNIVPLSLSVRCAGLKRSTQSI